MHLQEVAARSFADQKLARKLKQLNSRYMRSVDLISVGAYEMGSDAILDQAISRHDLIDQFLQQDIAERAGVDESIYALNQVLDGLMLN